MADEYTSEFRLHKKSHELRVVDVTDPLFIGEKCGVVFMLLEDQVEDLIEQLDTIRSTKRTPILACYSPLEDVLMTFVENFQRGPGGPIDRDDAEPLLKVLRKMTRLLETRVRGSSSPQRPVGVD